MKIGITERGDAGIDLSWYNKLNTVDGVILITKHITDTFIKAVMNCNKPAIVHVTCTGFGSTELEPNVPHYTHQLNQLQKLINAGFPANHCVLRIDPIFPTVTGCNQVIKVIDYFNSLNTGVDRIRVSIVDEYKHVKERYAAKGWTPIYGDRFYPDFNQIKLVANTLSRYNRTFETCAELQLANQFPELFQVTGCVSETDLKIMGITPEPMSVNGQNRYGCRCLTCKTELLEHKSQCPNGCVYCFWKK